MLAGPKPKTSRYYGSSEDMLVYYAWYRVNAKQRAWVGEKKPNDFGLFDAYGNSWEWCQERFKEYPFMPMGQNIENQNNIKFFIQRGGTYFLDG